jgi:hypothetical protein
MNTDTYRLTRLGCDVHDINFNLAMMLSEHLQRALYEVEELSLGIWYGGQNGTKLGLE